MKVVNRKVATFCLMVGMFLNPLGYDIIFAMILRLTDSYIVTTLIFYLLSAVFFGLFFLFSGINPINFIRDRFRDLKNKLKSNK